MSDSRYDPTPGPWRADGEHVLIDGDAGSIRVASARWGSTVETRRVRHITTPEAEANARLIAAAPDLLAACDDVQRAWVGDGVDMAAAVDRVLSAIAKATGSEVQA